MEFRILGSLEVDADRPVDLQGGKLRALLAMLVVNANQIVSADRLVEALWGDSATASSASSLRLHVSHLRQALGAATISTRSPGYVLVADPEHIDARRFERLAAAGRRALDTGDVGGAVELLGDALAEWRGLALAEFCYDAFAEREAARLEELRLVAVEDLAEAELAYGRHGDVAGRLRALVTEHPLRERLWSYLMLALYRCGRQADALRAYQSVRQALADELGIEPSRALQQLEEAILLQKPELELAPGAPGPGRAVARPVGTDPEPDGAALETAVALPARLGPEVAPAAFVGRTEQLAALAQSLQEACAGRSRRVVLISGEPGIGKTTLVSQFARDAHGNGATVLYGRCDEGTAVAYQPWAAVIGHLIEHTVGAGRDRSPTRAELGGLNAVTGPVADVVSAHGADLAHLGPEVAPFVRGGSGGSSDSEAARHLLFGAVRLVLEAAGRDRPVVLILDDLQWADTTSLALLRHVAGTDRPTALLIVGTFRDSDLATNDPLADVLAGLRRERGVRRLHLAGLDAGDLLHLVEADIGRIAPEASAALGQALARETDGNPFFAGELIRHAAESGLIRRSDDGGWVVALDRGASGLPAGVREVIDRRVARLGPVAGQVLAMAAVIGRDFDCELVASASAADADTVLDVLDAAIDATLVVNVAGERFSFVHALVQHALYDSLSPARRARAHRRVADTLEVTAGTGAAPRPAEIATHHLLAGDRGDVHKAIAFAAAAGDQARAQLAPGEALRWYRQALELLDRYGAHDERQRARLLVGLGDAQRQAGDPECRATLLEAARTARDLGDTGTLAEAVLADHVGVRTRTGFVDAERVLFIEAALASIDELDSVLRARLLSLLAIERAFDEDSIGRSWLTDEALAMARRLGDRPTILEVLLRRYLAIRVPDALRDRLAGTAEAVTLAAELGDPVDRFWAAHSRTGVIEAGDLAEFTRHRREASELAATIGQPTLRWVARSGEFCEALLAGDTARAEALADLTLQDAGATGEHDAHVVHGAQLYLVRWHQGRGEELIKPFAAMATANPQIPTIRSGLALLHVDSGQVDEACRLLTTEAATGFAHPTNYLLTAHLTLWAEVAARCGDRAAAATLYEMLSRWPDQVVFIDFGVIGATAHYLGMLAATLGRPGDAAAHYEKALATHERLEAPFHRARTHLEWGRLLLAVAGPDGDCEAARSHLDQARQLAERHGCSLVAAQARQAIAHAGAN